MYIIRYMSILAKPIVFWCTVLVYTKSKTEQFYQTIWPNYLLTLSALACAPLRITGLTIPLVGPPPPPPPYPPAPPSKLNI
jgi:hypothetical protein